MRDIDTLIVGGGQAGLAMSRCLAERGVEHVVLERGRVGERWRSERWDSLTLLTPRWQSRLPGFHAREGDPHGYMTRDEVVRLLDRFTHDRNAILFIESQAQLTCIHGGDVEQIAHQPQRAVRGALDDLQLQPRRARIGLQRVRRRDVHRAQRVVQIV